MKQVYFIGLRGFPDISGGIESHVENLVLQLQSTDLNLTCFGRHRFFRATSPTGTHRWIWLWAPTRNGLEAFLHTLLCVIYLAFCKRGVAHVHGIGPGACSPALRLLGYRVVVTHHGYDYARSKWGPFASTCLRIGEFLALHFANDIIAVSKTVAVELAHKYQRTVHYIPNGAPQSRGTGFLTSDHVFACREAYFLVASRLVPEKRIEDAITAFLSLSRTDVGLVIAGSVDVTRLNYEKFLREKAKAAPNIFFLGHVSHEILWSYMRGCLAFVSASSHEGLPIAVLEAGSQGAKLVLSKIPAHAEFELSADSYFEVGDIQELSTQMRSILMSDEATKNWRMSSQKISEYSWESIAKQTLRIYLKEQNIDTRVPK